MGAPTTAANGTLPQQVQGAYQGSVGGFGGLQDTGNQFIAGSAPLAQQGGDLYSELGGDAGQLSKTDLTPYMNPYTDDVINASMTELNRQHGIQQLGVDDQATAQGAFGGNRMYLQKGVMGNQFLDTKARMLADLYSKNFLNAQAMGQQDIGNRFMAAQGLSNLGLQGAQLGGNMASSGAGGLGDLASSGFQMANAANAAQVSAAQAAQQQQQDAINAANANYARLLGIPEEYLAAMMGISSGLGNFGTTKQNVQQDPGLISTIGAGAGILGAIAGIPI